MLLPDAVINAVATHSKVESSFIIVCSLCVMIGVFCVNFVCMIHCSCALLAFLPPVVVETHESFFLVVILTCEVFVKSSLATFRQRVQECAVVSSNI